MSRVTEIAEREAQEVESDHLADDEQEPAEEENGEPDRDPEPPAELPSDQLMEEIGKKLDAEAARHRKRVAEITGDMMGDLVDCPLCFTPGFVTVVPPVDFDPLQREAVLAAMGDGDSSSPDQDPDVETCPRCRGFGIMLTGARNELNYTRNCTLCASRGYIDPKEVAALEQANRDASAGYTPSVPAPYVIPGVTGGVSGDPSSAPQAYFDYVTNSWRLP